MTVISSVEMGGAVRGGARLAGGDRDCISSRGL
jgi:hypothetical protein